MSSIFDFAKSVLTLTASVDRLSKVVSELSKRVEENRERIVRLEQREDVLAERMARQATEAVARIHGQHLERILQLEARLESRPGLRGGSGEES